MLFARVGSHSVNPAINATLPYTFDEFRYVMDYEINPVACAVAPSSGIKTTDELVAKANAGTASYSSAGVGSLLYLSAVRVMDRLGVEGPGKTVTHIPQKGGGEAEIAVLNGAVTFICDNISTPSNFVANDQLIPLMVTTATPVVGLDASNATDLGKPALTQLVGWTGIAGPASLPDTIATLTGAVGAGLVLSRLWLPNSDDAQISDLDDRANGFKRLRALAGIVAITLFAMPRLGLVWCGP